MPNVDDFSTLVSSLQASTVEWNTLGASFRLSSSGVFSGATLRSRYMRFAQVLDEIEQLFSAHRLSPSSALVAWCASLQDSGVAPHFVGLLVELILQGNLPYLALRRCLRLIDVFLDWATQPNAGNDAAGSGGESCPILIPSHTVVKWVEQTWSAIQSLSRDNAGTSTPTATAGLCGALQLLPVLLRWNTGNSPLPPFRRGQLPHPVNTLSEEARVLAFRCLPYVVQHQPDAVNPQSVAHEIIEYIKRGCVKSTDVFVRIAAGSSLRGALENGLRVSSPAVAYGLMDMLLCLCDDVAPYDIADEVLNDVGVAMGYLLAFYQSDFTVDALSDVLQAAVPQNKGAAAAEERAEPHRRGAGNASSAAGPSGGVGSASAAAGVGRLRWKFFGGADAVEGSRVVQRCFNERMTCTAQRALATALATLCSLCSTPSTTASAIQCCFVLLIPLEGDTRAYMPRLLADAIQEWARQLPSNGYRVMLADVLRGYVQKSSEDKAVVRTAMVALQGVVRTLSSSLEIGFNVAADVVAAVNTTPSLLHAGVEVLAAVARTNTLYARQLQHQCARADSAEVANTLSFQLHIRALLDASADATEANEALGEEDIVSLVHMCIRLLLRLSRGDPPRIVQDIHYRQAELIFRLTQLIYNLLHGSPVAVLRAVRDELQPCTLGFMNLLVSSPASSIAFYKAVTAACAMLRRAPLVSDTERMLAVGFLESSLASQDGVARHSTATAASSAATAYFAVSKGALYHLVACAPWPTCRDDGSLRWLAAQALKDVARACASAAPVLSFAEIYGAAMASAAQSMRLVRGTLFHPCVSANTSSAAAETPAHPLEECGGRAVRLLRWTLRHFVGRGAVPVCVGLLTSLYTDLFKVYTTPVNAAAAVEEQVRQGLRREISLWNTLCTVHELLLEATQTTADVLWADTKWKAEVNRWHTLTTELVAAAAREVVEVRLLAAKVLALCLVSTGQVSVFTSHAVASVAQGSPSKSVQMDAFGPLMVLCEAHSLAGEVALGSAAESSTTLPLATSLLSDSWRRLVCAAPTSNAAFAAPLLVLLSLRLAQVYPAEVEVALSDSVVHMLLTPMTSANTQWWSSMTVVGMLTAAVQLWSAFAGANASVLPVPQSTALLLVQEALFAAMQSHQTPACAINAALDAVEQFTQHHESCSGEESCVAWRRMLHMCLEHTTHIPHEAECVPSPLMQHKGRSSFHRFVVQRDEVSKRVARLWRTVLLGNGMTPLVAAAVAEAGGSRRLTLFDVATQTDLATAAAVRREWVTVAQALWSSLLPHVSTTITTPTSLTRVIYNYLETVHIILQSRSPDVQVDITKRDKDMLVAEMAGEEEAAADDVRGGAGGSGSDDVEDYAAEFEDEGTGGILSEAGGTAGRGNASAACAAGNGPLSAATLTFDVAAKEAAMWVLYGVLRALGNDGTLMSPSQQPQAQQQRADEVRRAVLPIVVAAAQLVEVHPEVHIATTAVLHEVFSLWGDVTQGQELARPLAVLMPWKTQLVVSLTTILQHGLFSLEGCTAVAVQYSRCNLADTNSCRRVLRSLLLLLHACHRLQERHRAFLLGGSSGAGHIIIAIAKVAQSPAMTAEKLEAAQGVLVRTLVSQPCQAALTLLCERFVTAVALADGYVPPPSAFGGGWAGDDDDDEEDQAAAAVSVYGSHMSMTANDVLHAVAFVVGEPLSATMGPALRYATGCLASLVLATLIHPAPITALSRPPNSSSAESLRFVVALSGKLTSQHQCILAQLAQQRLLHIVSSWEQRRNAEDTGASAETWDEITALLRIAAAASMSSVRAEELLHAFTPYVTKADTIASTASRFTEVAASLLCVGMAAKVERCHLRPLIHVLPADALVKVLPSSTVLRLQHLTAVYVQDSTGGGQQRQEVEGDSAHALALAGPTGLLLIGRCAAAEALPPIRSPLLDAKLWPAVLQLLCRATSPIKAVEYLCPSPATTVVESSLHPALALRGCVKHHGPQINALLALFAALDSTPSTVPSSSSAAASSLKARATFVLHCGPLLCELLLAKMTHTDPAVAAADSLHEVLLYVVTLLSTALAPAFAVALNEVGRHLVRTVALTQGVALREAIHRLEAAKASQLRVFMEDSCK